MNQLGTSWQTTLVCRVRILTNPVAFSRFIALWGVDAVTEELPSLPSKAAKRSPCQRIGSTESPYRIGRRSVTNDLGDALGRQADARMARTIQFEGQKLELAARRRKLSSG